jgi:RNA recognition motif-containing protein
MATKLYVGNLSYGTTNASLETLFSEFGAVQSAQVIMDRDTGRSKGFGFVEMSDAQSGQAAIAGLNGKEVDGRSLTVNEARPREDRGGGGGGGPRRGGGGGGYGERSRY